MDQHAKSELIKSYHKRYIKVSKKEKTAIIITIIDAKGYVIRALS